jgi:hypothetical protein
MRNRLIVAALIVLMAVAAAPAQSVRLVADIPFTFVAGDSTLPAGQYTVEPMSSHVVRLRCADLRSSALFQTIGVSGRDLQGGGKLIFNRYGETYFLFQIWSPGYSTGHELPKSRLERRLAQSEPTPLRREVAFQGAR